MTTLSILLAAITVGLLVKITLYQFCFKTFRFLDSEGYVAPNWFRGLTTVVILVLSGNLGYVVHYLLTALLL